MINKNGEKKRKNTIFLGTHAENEDAKLISASRNVQSAMKGHCMGVYQSRTERCRQYPM